MRMTASPCQSIAKATSGPGRTESYTMLVLEGSLLPLLGTLLLPKPRPNCHSDRPTVTYLAALETGPLTGDFFLGDGWHLSGMV